jgi:hypothetical protein
MTKSPLRSKVRAGLHRYLIRLGIDTRKKRPDRIALEKIIFPELQRDPQYQTILFVGCAWYTLHYPSLFRGKKFHTMEIDPDQACFGSTSHVVGSCEELHSQFDRGQFDCIVFNGVFGFGLNTPSALDRTLRGMHYVMRPDGLLIFGWNDLPAHAPFPPFSSASWSLLEPYHFPPFDAERFSSDSINRHCFHFFRTRP